MDLLTRNQGGWVRIYQFPVFMELSRRPVHVWQGEVFFLEVVSPFMRHPGVSAHTDKCIQCTVYNTDLTHSILSLLESHTLMCTHTQNRRKWVLKVWLSSRTLGPACITPQGLIVRTTATTVKRQLSMTCLP